MCPAVESFCNGGVGVTTYEVVLFGSIFVGVVGALYSVFKSDKVGAINSLALTLSKFGIFVDPSPYTLTQKTTLGVRLWPYTRTGCAAGGDRGVLDGWHVGGELPQFG